MGSEVHCTILLPYRFENFHIQKMLVGGSLECEIRVLSLLNFSSISHASITSVYFFISSKK